MAANDESSDPRCPAPQQALSDLRPIDGDDRHPAPAPADTVAAHAAALGLDDTALDELVHAIASRAASAINNSGIDGQVRYLVEQLGAARALVEVDAAAGR